MRKRDVLLTFDAGGDAAGAWRILRTLRHKHVVATFFLTGRWVDQYRLLAKFTSARPATSTPRRSTPTRSPV